MFRLVTTVVSAILIPSMGFSLWLQLRQVPDLGGNVFWFLSGVLVMGITFYAAAPSVIRLVVMHELSHALVGWLLGARVHSVVASDTEGGAIESEFDSWGGELISLAPYFFQPASLLLLVVKGIAVPTWGPALCFLLGLAWAGFYFDLWTTLRVPQTDITRTGSRFSLLVIVALNLLISGAVLSSISEDTSVVAFLIDGPTVIWETLCGGLQSLMPAPLGV